MSKPVFYTFGASVWCVPPELAIPELGYSDEAIDIKTVNLVHGENFTPEFLNINSNGTLPTLVADGKTYTSTKDVIEYLVSNASVQVAPATDLTDIVHEDQYDPNFILLAAKNDDELAAKASGFPKLFVANRQKALEAHAAHPDAAPHAAFYAAKQAANGALLALYEGRAPAAAKAGFFEQTQAHWARVAALVRDTLPAHLPDAGFVGGARPGVDDFHLGAWLARVVFVLGGSGDKDGVKVLEKEIGGPVPPKVVSYWAAWTERPSWQKVYPEGKLH